MFIYFKISNATDLNLNNNQAYAIKITHQRDLAYEVTTISTGEPETSQAVTNELESELEPTYETVQLSSAQTKKRPGSQTGENTSQLEPNYENLIIQQSSVQTSSSQKDEDDYI